MRVKIPPFVFRDSQTQGTTLQGTQISTLPLTEESVTHPSKLVPEVDILASWQRLGE
jgi:hypothetical protein